MRILYAEDEISTRELLAEIILKKFPRADLIKASDGLVAKKMLKHFEPDIMITDIHMPTLDGKELVKFFKTIYPNKPIIITTSYIEETDGIRADCIIKKPIEADILISSISNLLPEHFLDNSKKVSL